MNEVLLLSIILVSVAVSAVGHRIRVQPGILVVALGAAASFIPGLPRLELEPETILAVVVPPLLYSATLSFSFQTFTRNLRPILGLGVGLVLVTMGAVGLVTTWVLPAVAVSAFVLAAVVAPPDTVTTVTHGREIGLPRRVIAILTGESLVNDATALALFAVAVAAVGQTHTFIENPVLLFLYAAIVGAIIGQIIGVLAAFVRSRLGNPTLETVVGLIVPFIAYLAAEQFEASGVIAVVMAGFTISMGTIYSGQNRPGRERLPRASSAYQVRLQESTLWPVIDNVLEAFVFAYIGLQLRFVVEDLMESGGELGPTLLAAGLILLTVIVVRLVWCQVLFGRRPRVRAESSRKAVSSRRAGRTGRGPGRPRRGGDQRAAMLAHKRDRSEHKTQVMYLDPSSRLLVGWTGMRGIVTLAAAAGIPLTTASGEPFPGRSEIQVIAFVVTIGTLLIQGLTLPPLARKLDVDTSAEDEEADRKVREAIDIDRETLQNAFKDKRSTTDRGALRKDMAHIFDERRARLADAVREERIDDETARLAIHQTDLEQAAFAGRAEFAKAGGIGPDEMGERRWKEKQEREQREHKPDNEHQAKHRSDDASH